MAIAPSSKGFGFVVLEGLDTLVTWGGKRAEDNKNSDCLRKAQSLIAYYQPGVLVLEDSSAKGSKRAPRIRQLSRRLAAIAKDREVRVQLLSRAAIQKTFFADGGGTKYEIAEMVAERFSEDLGPHLPPKRKLGDSEDARMDIFAAAALITAYRLRRAHRTAYGNTRRAGNEGTA